MTWKCAGPPSIFLKIPWRASFEGGVWPRVRLKLSGDTVSTGAIKTHK